MAAPHVTGVVTLLAAARPEISVAEIRTAILGTATPVASLAGPRPDRASVQRPQFAARRACRKILLAFPKPPDRIRHVPRM
jgi:hypothetical protein